MILSASRRTDIPSFYPEWFLSRLRAGSVLVRNPMNAAQISEIPLTPENVDCIVFWTKDPRPLFPYLDEIGAMGYPCYFQFTLTPYGREIEPGVGDKKEIAAAFRELSARVGRERVILRYDPILMTEGKYTREYHAVAFQRLCELLGGYTERVIISFLDSYRKIADNMARAGIRKPDDGDTLFFAECFSGIAKNAGLSLETCAERADLSRFGIGHSSCVDGDLIERILGRRIRGKQPGGGSREACGCMKSIDIGQYDTCVHGCRYCYANSGRERALANYAAHRPSSPILAGVVDTGRVKPRSGRDTGSLKLMV